MCCKDEYLMLREEILHVGTMKNNTLNFMYALIGVVLSFSLTQDDNLYILVIYIILIPTNAIVFVYDQGMYKLGTYLLVFHEKDGSDFQWESRQRLFYRIIAKNRSALSGQIGTYNMPFLFMNLFTTGIFLIKTDWINVGTFYEGIKMLACLILFMITCVSIYVHRVKNLQEKYTKYWEAVKAELTDVDVNSSSEAIKLL